MVTDYMWEHIKNFQIISKNLVYLDYGKMKNVMKIKPMMKEDEKIQDKMQVVGRGRNKNWKINIEDI